MFLLENRTRKATNENLAFFLTCEQNPQVVFHFDSLKNPRK